jgi:hypothetical protein
MPRAWSITKRQAGFSPVEILLAAAVLGFIVTALVGALVYGRAATADAGDHTRAVQLADEGIQAVTNIGNAAFANLTNGTFGLVQSGGIWTLSGTSDTTGIYSRSCVIADGTTTTRKTVTCTVTWSNPQANSTSATTLLTNWPAAIKTWTNTAVTGVYNPATTTNAIKVDSVGDYAYVILSAATNNFLVVNISNPAVPTITATFSVASTPTNVVVSGGYAYVTTSSDTAELQIVDVTTPSAPVIRSSVNMIGTGDPQSVAISGKTAYVARTNDTTTNAFEVTTVNVTTATAPVVLGGYNLAVNMTGIYVNGNYAYVSTTSTTQEMLVLNITNPVTPTLTFTYNPATAVAATTVAGFGNTVYLGVGSTIRAIDITNPGAPAAQATTFTAAGTVNKIDVDVTGQFGFLATSGTAGEFQVVNIINPASITLVKTVDVAGTTSTITGVSYNSTYDVVVGASASDTQEVVVFPRI